MSQGDTADRVLLTLEGFTIGVTADRRADEQAELLRRHGARVVHGPSVSITPLADEATLRTATQRVIGARPDLLLVNTGIGMRTWLAAAEAWDVGRALLASRARVGAGERSGCRFRGNVQPLRAHELGAEKA